MTNRRIEYNAHDGSHYAQLLNQMDAYSRAVADGDQAAAAGAADQVRQLAEQLSDHALLAAVDGHASGRSIAAQLGVVHGTVQYRIKQARARAESDEEDQA